MQSKTRRSWKLGLIFCCATCLGEIGDTIFAQNLPQVLTMKTDLQYEGELASIASIIPGTSVYATYDAQNIVRIDDGLRNVFVSKNRVNGMGESSLNEIEIPIFQRTYSGSDGNGGIIKIGPFNEYGHRELIVRAPGIADPVVYVQGITKISPRYCVVETLTGARTKSVEWKMNVATSTVPTDVLRNLMRTQITDPENSSEYLKVAEFFLQAQQFGHALEELRFIQKKFPDLAERIEDDRALVRQASARKILREVRLRLDAGQIELATGLAKAFSKEGLAGELLAEFNDIESEVNEAKTRLDETRSKVAALINDVQNLDERQIVAARQLKDELESDLNTVNALRLDSYLRLASDATMPAQQKLALAISGWILGSNKAIENLAIAEDLFTVRGLVRKFLLSKDPAEREHILTQLAEFESGTPAYLAPLIQQMKPIQPPDLSSYHGDEPIEFTVSLPGPAIAPQTHEFRCLVQLPPEYDPYRRYPLLIALRDVSQTADQHLNMWCGSYDPNLKVRLGQASRNGYIVMAVDWMKPGQTTYGYSGREHATVTKALRAALRMFSIDSDRVFLSGHGIGGEAAYDIGLSHPEHWAGVIGVSAKMDRYQDVYRKNKHLALPVYSVVGSKDYITILANNDAWNVWLPSRRYLDCTLVMYDGRGNELFVEDIPETFRWMNAQRRRWPDKTGFSFDCRTLRPWDCYFWFVEFDGIPVDMVIWPEDWRDKNIPRFTIEGSMKGEVPNRFKIGPASNKAVRPATLWLSPEFVNFDEEIQITGVGKDFKGFAKPTSKVLLEDVRSRAEREHPYWARINLKGFQWVPE